MDPRTVAELARFDASLPLEEASAPPSSWYTDRAFHDLELRTIFARRWLFACPSSEVSEPGSWQAGCHAGRPWVVVRGEDGQLRAFHNVCRHRGAEVVGGPGQGGELVCQYHGWRYRLDGSLRSAPRMGPIRSFDRDAMALPPLAVEEVGPFVLVNADVDAAPFEAMAPGAAAALGLRREGCGRWLARRSYDIGCNWKAFADNYLDGGYHIPNMHPTLDAQLDMASYRTELFEGWSLQTSPAGTGDDPRARVDVQARIAGGARYAFVFPTLMINRYGPFLDTNVVTPLAPDRCRVQFDFWFEGDPEEDAAFVAESLEQTHRTQLEDVAISESVQRGTGSPSFDRGRYAPLHEKGIHHFHRQVAADLRRDASTGRGGDARYSL